MPEKSLAGRVVRRTSFLWHGTSEPCDLHSPDPSRPAVMTAATGKVFFLQRGNNACSRQFDRPRLQSSPSQRKVADGYYGIRAFRREGISIPYNRLLWRHAGHLDDWHLSGCRSGQYNVGSGNCRAAAGRETDCSFRPWLSLPLAGVDRLCGQNPGQGERKGLCPQSRTFRCQYNSIICSSAIIGCSVRLLTLPPLFHLWKTLHRWKKECHRNDTLSDHDWYVYLWFWNILTNPFCKRKCRKPCDLLHFGVANIFIYWSFMGRLQKLRNFRFPHLHGQH